MDQSWFEMKAIRKRRLDLAVWIPLRAISDVERVGTFGFPGFKEEFFGAGTLAVPLAARESANELGWSDIGISHHHSPYVQDGTYRASDVYNSHSGDFQGLHLVLEQRANRLETREWYLHHDLVLGLGLRREGDVWVSPHEGYVEVVRLRRNNDGSPSTIEIRAEHLKDFLCARCMALHVTSYRNRMVVVEDATHIRWPQSPICETDGGDRWEGRVYDIHEGGHAYGATTAVFHAARTDVDPDEEVPSLGPPSETNIKSRSWTLEDKRRKVSVIQGELWRKEWIEPAESSPRIRGDRERPTVFFITDAAGTLENRETLEGHGRWLWFRPDVMMAIAHRRGGELSWYTRDTGSVSCSTDHSVDFGINKLGLVNVYAKDIAQLSEWEQRMWAGYNVGPDGGVSEELLASQVRADPSRTQAPEPFLGSALARLDKVGEAKLGAPLRRLHDQVNEIVARTHRFRAVDKTGLFALAKDLARLTADSLDASTLHKLLNLPKDDRPRSLRALEQLVARKVGADRARQMLGPLVGIYELRLADAHLPRTEIAESFALVGIDESLPCVHQGLQMLDACVSTIYAIAEALER